MNIQHLRADYLIHKYFHFSALPQLSPDLFRTLDSIFFTTLAITIVLLLIRKILTIKDSLIEPSILLEITPPAYTEKTAYTNPHERQK
jgi:uncharacterized protein Smg (DUF494 family)